MRCGFVTATNDTSAYPLFVLNKIVLVLAVIHISHLYYFWSFHDKMMICSVNIRSDCATYKIVYLLVIGVKHLPP